MSEAVVCSLDPELMRARAQALRQGLFRGLTTVEALADESGMRLHFDGRQVTRAELEEFAAFESQCCRFASFDIAEDGPRGLSLRIAGPEGTREFVAGWLHAGAPSERHSRRPAGWTVLAGFGGAGLLCCAAPLLAAAGFAGVAGALGPGFEAAALAALGVGGWTAWRRRRSWREPRASGSHRVASAIPPAGRDETTRGCGC